MKTLYEPYADMLGFGLFIIVLILGTIVLFPYAIYSIVMEGINKLKSKP